MKGPILLHVGYHKTGSGWLRRCFFIEPRTGFGSLGKDPASHPVRGFVLEPSLSFDHRAFQARFEELTAPVEAAGLVPVLSFERLVGHPFSGGYDSKELADRLAAVFPTGRVLVVVREQRAIISSIYRQYVREGGPCTLEAFVEPPRTPSARAPMFDLRFYEYHRLIAYYLELFGPERLLVLAYKQLAEDPRAYVSAIAGFAGLRLNEDVLASLPFDARSNPSPSATAIELARRVNRLGGRANEIAPAPLIRSKVLKRLSRHLEHVRFPEMLDVGTERRFGETIGRHIAGFYAESNRRTAELTGLDLAAYGWAL
jgi:hypothetical protein